MSSKKVVGLLAYPHHHQTVGCVPSSSTAALVHTGTQTVACPETPRGASLQPLKKSQIQSAASSRSADWFCNWCQVLAKNLPWNLPPVISRTNLEVFSMDPKVFAFHWWHFCECIIHAFCSEDSPWNWDLLWKRSVSKEQQITRSFETKKEDFHSLMVHTHKAPFYNPYDLVHLPCHHSSRHSHYFAGISSSHGPTSKKNLRRDRRIETKHPELWNSKNTRRKKGKIIAGLKMFVVVLTFLSDLLFQEW